MKTKDKILAKIKGNKSIFYELPDLTLVDVWNEPINIDKLVQNTKVVGGELYQLQSLKEVEKKIKQLFPNANSVYCTVDGIEIGNVKINETTAIQELAKLDLAILKGNFIVEENAAVWITEKDMDKESIITITEYLVLIIEKKNIIKNMHQAYKNINLKDTSYGTFISGPSKTADIEQTLVFGAHGAKKLAIFLV